MAEIVRMPKLSDTMTEGVVAEWYKKVGDTVAEGDLLADIETDKATMEFESFYDGILLHIGIEKGGAAPVNDILAIIGEKGEDISALLKDAEGKEEEAAPKEEPKEEKAPQEVTKPEKAVEASQPTLTKTSESNDGGRVFASPLARKMAEDKGINLSMVNGTGENNRITKKDIENFNPANAGGSAMSQSVNTGVESYTDMPLSQMRKAIAKTLSASKFSAPHFYLKVSVNMDNMIASRKVINADDDVRISFNDMIIKATASALRKNPKVNSDWTGDAIRYNDHIHIGVAVAVDEGLLVPVIRFADTKGFAQIGSEVKVLAEKARTKKIQPDEMQGGTFAISNLGNYGIEDFTSIINPPNSCILSVGEIKAMPIVKDGEIVPGNIMKLTLACDHRAVDGAVGSAFLKDLKNLLENPVKMIV
ncbi:pyruvate dehydrogenase complex dihydrolipoamide acetyltransferase [Crocinitomix catalasitica]|uniref:pyruvate dehydrogenase complex dihydrolipoamide acetyltransferase n=1 Tax=Crocinitomix catalasitica TaxID=184607 RepID=UPI000480AE8E|nr:pyruvate dehydrogenase complex dihydrolipoamide acetyltransferase [Crocinitomix catalasitica]